MRCEDVQPLLSDHLDGALAPAEGAAVDGHLAGCAACRAELEDLRAVVAMLHAVPGEAMPGGLFDRIAAALAHEGLPDAAELGCDEARDLLSARLEHDVDADEAEALEAHLAGCDACRLQAAQLEAVVGLLRRVPREIPPADLADRVRAALAREGAEAPVVAAAPAAPVAIAAQGAIACDEAEDYMTGHLEGDLDGWEARALGAHVAGCAPCTRKLAQLEAVVGLLARVPREDVPADLAARVARALEALPADGVVPLVGGRARAPRAPGGARGVAAGGPAGGAPRGGARAPPRPDVRRRWSHWASSFAGAAAACAVFLVWQFTPGAGVPRIETAAVTVKQDVAVNIGFDVDEGVDGVIFQVDLPEGLKFIDDKAQPMLAQSVSWKGSLEKGKTVVPIVVRGIRPGRYEIEAFVRKGSMKRKTTIVLPVQG